jgi:anti-sigma regulatory factor (Ser/Thr protein kinase)
VKRVTADFAVSEGPVGTTCLFAVFDPLGQEVTLAGAGHPRPVVLGADGRARTLDMPVGPPLGAPGASYECASVAWNAGDVLVLGTRGLVPSGTVYADALEKAVAGPATGAEPDLGEVCDRAIRRLGADRGIHDAALMAVRLRELEPDRHAHRLVDADPRSVGRARAWAAERLHEWGLSELEFTTELIVSELVTNAQRYGAPPLELRLIREDALTCEVSDQSSTSPHVRHAADTDEGGRGLFLITQLAELWGTRYHDRGKCIWAQQALPDAG